MKYAKYIGGYYRILGWFSLACVVLGIAISYCTDKLILDFTFIIWLWLGGKLQQSNPTARKWAIGISLLVTLGILIGLLTGTGKARFFNFEFMPSTIQFYLIALLLFILIALPGLMLLSKKAKKEFKKIPNEENPE